MSVWRPRTNVSPVDLAYERSLLPSDIFDGENDEVYELEPVPEQSLGSLWDDTPARPSPPNSAAELSSLTDSFSSFYFPTPIPLIPAPGQELPSSSGRSSYARSNQNKMTPRIHPHNQAPGSGRQQRQQQEEADVTPYEKRQQELLHNFMIQDIQRQNSQYQEFIRLNRQKITRQFQQIQQENELAQIHADYNNNVFAILPQPSVPALVLSEQAQVMKMQHHQQQQQKQPSIMNTMQQQKQPSIMNTMQQQKQPSIMNTMQQQQQPPMMKMQQQQQPPMPMMKMQQQQQKQPSIMNTMQQQPSIMNTMQQQQQPPMMKMQQQQQPPMPMMKMQQQQPPMSMMKMQQQQPPMSMMKMQQQQPPMSMMKMQQQQPPMMVFCNGVPPPNGVPIGVPPPGGPGQFFVHPLHPGFKFNGHPPLQPQPQSQPPVQEEFVCKYRRRRHHLPSPGRQ